MSDIPDVEAYLANLIGSLEPPARRDLAIRVAKALRARNQKRIAAQIAPDGSAFEPRKPQLRHQKGRVKRQMFAKMRTARYLKARGTADAAIVGFTAEVSRIARVHQLGLRDKVNRKTGLEADYPKRELIGISADDEALIMEMSVAQLADRL